MTKIDYSFSTQLLGNLVGNDYICTKIEDIWENQ